MSDNNRGKGVEPAELQAAAQFLPSIYAELRRLAAREMAKEAPGQTLDPTALVHEVYLRLVGTCTKRRWKDHGHFYRAAAHAMRHILVDRARRKKREKHGGLLDRVAFDESLPRKGSQANDMLALDEAISHLTAHDPDSAAVVQLRYFAGLSVEEAADSLGMSRATAYRHWTFARAWLLQRLS